MNWWLDLSDGPIRDVQIVEAVLRCVAVRLSPTTVSFYAVDGGVFEEELDISVPEQGPQKTESWRAFLDSLVFARRAAIRVTKLSRSSGLRKWERTGCFPFPSE